MCVSLCTSTTLSVHLYNKSVWVLLYITNMCPILYHQLCVSLCKSANACVTLYIRNCVRPFLKKKYLCPSLYQQIFFSNCTRATICVLLNINICVCPYIYQKLWVHLYTSASVRGFIYSSNYIFPSVYLQDVVSICTSEFVFCTSAPRQNFCPCANQQMRVPFFTSTKVCPSVYQQHCVFFCISANVCVLLYIIICLCPSVFQQLCVSLCISATVCVHLYISKCLCLSVYNKYVCSSVYQ